MELFERIHADPNIDYLVMHIWPKNWGWLDVSDIAEAWHLQLRRQICI
jgi:mannan endo-1,4-beta-mannosidase